MSYRDLLALLGTVALACGSSDSDRLLGRGSERPDLDPMPSSGGAGGATVIGSGGTADSGANPPTGGTGGLDEPGSGGVSVESGGASAVDAHPPGSGGDPSLPDGAWSRCASDADCYGDRVCTQSFANTFAPGLNGACVQPCFGTSAARCDPGPQGANVVCTQLFLVGVCGIACGPGGACPEGFACATGFCWLE